MKILLIKTQPRMKKNNGALSQSMRPVAGSLIVVHRLGMTTFYLIRHATNDTIGRTIAGRAPEISLNAEGRQQAEQLAKRLAKERINIIASSPLERAVETAVPLAKRLDLDVQITDAFTELDYGDWTKQKLEQLDTVPKWQQWNSFRSGHRIPNGEMMVEVQARMIAEIQRLRIQYPEQGIAIFSHGDPIRAVLAYYMGVPLDLFTRIEIDPASVSIILLNEYAPKILCVNR
ncbi:MAG: Phosphoglycerate mutase [Pedosphaera sp.]|nr:Phosphoglycerate mutase [Pedosphaera sp.]